MSGSNTTTTTARLIPPVSVFARITEELRINPSIAPPKKPGILGTVDRFELLDFLGEGGMGVVFLAQDANSRPVGANVESGDQEQSVLAREEAGSHNKETSASSGAQTTGIPPQRPRFVALKLLKYELAQERRAVEYFLKEARHMQRLSHPNILPVLEFFEKPSGCYFITPYMERGSLDGWLRAGQPLDSARALRIALDLASALNYAHGRGIIHRDIKPQNILLDVQERACLTDFGLARSLLNDSLTDVRRGAVEGTPQYLSPNAARGEHEDTRTDIYSFGAVLYQMLTAQAPYSGKSRDEIFQQIQTGPPVPIHQINPEASRPLIRIVEKAMARSLEERYVHMSYVLSDLEKLAADDSSSARLNAGGLKKLPLSNSNLVHRPALAAVIVVSLVCAVGLFFWPYGRKTATGGAPTMPANSGTPALTLVHKLELRGIWHWFRAKLVDWNGDGIPEILLPLPSDKKFLIVSTSGQVLRDWPLPLPLADDLNAFAGGQQAGSAPVIASWRNGPQLFISLLNSQLHETKRLQFRGQAFQTETGLVPGSGIADVIMRDLDGDGNPELLAFVFSTRQKKAASPDDVELISADNPRGLFCFSPSTGKLLWRHLTASALKTVEFPSLGRQDAPEILLGTAAVWNICRAPDGTSDTSSYLCAVSSGGTHLWNSPALGGPFTESTPLLIDENHDGNKTIFAWVTGSHEHRKSNGLSEVGEIVRLDHGGKVTARYDFGVRLMSCTASDLDRDGRPEILATDRFGNLHCVDTDLSLRMTVNVVSNRHDFVELTIVAVEDLDQDGQPEIILSSMQQKIVSGMNEGSFDGENNVRFFYDISVLILDASFEQIAKYSVADKWQERQGMPVYVADMDGDHKPEIVVLTDKVEILKFTRDKRSNIAGRLRIGDGK